MKMNAFQLVMLKLAALAIVWYAATVAFPTNSVHANAKSCCNSSGECSGVEYCNFHLPCELGDGTCVANAG